MTWYRESYRHSLAARGIPTVAYRVARQYHLSRPIQDRLRDEDRSEPLTEEIGLWSEHIDEFDIRGIDDPVPDGYRLETEREICPGGERVRIKIFDGDIGVGKISAIETDEMIHIMNLSVEHHHLGKGISRYLMREAINLADEKGKGLDIDVASYGDMPISDQDLIRYYSSFGFEPHEKCQFALGRRARR